MVLKRFQFKEYLRGRNSSLSKADIEANFSKWLFKRKKLLYFNYKILQKNINFNPNINGYQQTGKKILKKNGQQINL